MILLAEINIFLFKAATKKTTPLVETIAFLSHLIYCD